MDKFLESIEQNHKITKYLKVGMTFSEIYEYFKSVVGNGSVIDRRIMRMHLLNHSKNKGILMADPDYVAQTIGGMRFVLRATRHGSNSRRKPLGSGKTYKYGNIYYSPDGTSCTRVLYEMIDSSIGTESSSLKILNIIGESPQITRKELTDKLAKKYSYHYPRLIDYGIPRLLKNNYLIEKNGKYKLSTEITPCYSPQIREIWDEFRGWEHRRKFYPSLI